MQTSRCCSLKIGRLQNYYWRDARLYEEEQ